MQPGFRVRNDSKIKEGREVVKKRTWIDPLKSAT